jgi:hypothetical protein
MGNTPFDRTGQLLNTDVPKVSVDEAFLAHFQVSAANAVAASIAGVLAATALKSAIQSITTGIANPAVPRNVTVTGNAAGITGNVTIHGTNFAGNTITEVIALNGTPTVAGAKAFKTITEIDLPIKTNGDTDSVRIGFGSCLGLPYLLSHNTVLAAFLGNVKEGTAPTVTTSTTNIENNTIAINSALNSSVVDIYLMV